jgi:hypothetical protein
MTSSPDDRNAILRRRARFVGSALLALAGCGGEQAKPPPESPVDVPPAHATPAPATPAPGPSKQATLPPLDVPEDARGTARQMYEGLAVKVTRVHDKLDEMNRLLPDACDLSEKGEACGGAWRLVAKDLDELRFEISEFTPLCPGQSSEAQAFQERVEQHTSYANDRLQALNARIERAFSSAPGGAEGWREFAAKERTPRPVACLDCATW